MRLLVVSLVGAALAVGSAHAAPPSIHAVTEPATVGVGDTLTYVVEARVDADTADTSSVRVFADTGPFTPVGAAQTRRRTESSAVVVELRQDLACLELACAPIHGLRRIQLPAARVTVRLTDGSSATARGPRASVAVRPRVASDAVRASPPPYRRETVLPAPTGRAGRLAVVLEISTVVLGLIALVLAFLAFKPRPRPHSRESDVRRALRLLRESTGRPAPDRRRAASLVSRLARRGGAQAVADDAAHLAWSASPPDPTGAATLADRAERAVR